MAPGILKDLFTSVASGTVTAQSRLDERLPHRPRWVYSLPRVRVDARFGVTQVAGRTFWWFGNSSRQDRRNTLHFRLVACGWDVAPPALPSSAASSALVVRGPAFLVPPVERERFRVELVTDLRAADRRRYADEIDAIDEALNQGKDDRGITFLRLAPHRILIVRLGGGNDGIFLRDEAATPRHTVLSYMGMGDGPLPWAPFHELFEMLREWQQQGCPLVPIPGTAPPPSLGSIEVTSFTTDLALAVNAARAELGAAAADRLYPVHYSLQDVGADLAYSVARGTGAAAAAESPLIRSVAAVRLDADERPSVSLLSPEYILTGAQRSAFFELFDDFLARPGNDSTGLWRHLDREYRSSYQHALEDPRRRRDALVLLSYRGKTPVNQFLVVWTGAVLEMGNEGEEREFAFRVRLDEERLVYAAMVLPLEDALQPGSMFGSSQKPFRLAQVNYNADRAGLHDFFHACWIWDLTGEWYHQPVR